MNALETDTRRSNAFIDHARIEDWLRTEASDRKHLLDIVDKARQAGGLEPGEVAALLAAGRASNGAPGAGSNGAPDAASDLWDEVFATARHIKETIYGRRMVLFAPLYISNFCVNACHYCGYRTANPMARRRLSQEEIRDEVRVLLSMGHKRLVVEAGEDPRHCPIDYALEAIQTIYDTDSPDGRGAIRRVNVNIAATSVANYRRLVQAGIGTYILFQETYHHPTYTAVHPSGPKSDYLWHLRAMDRAMAGGIDDVGLGALFGLYDWRFELLALLLHARHLETTHGVGPHTISVPRLRPAFGVDPRRFPYLVTDEDFRRLVALIRLAVPYTGMILSTRERPGFRDEVFGLGVSQLSAGSCTGVGGYRQEAQTLADQRPARETGRPPAHPPAAQFAVEDHRSPDELIRELCRSGYLPSYCTACYRRGRTGDRFMSLAKAGEIKELCLPNALLTLKEYLLDYASPATRETAERAIPSHLADIKKDAVWAETVRRLARLEAGERDLYF